MNRLGALLQRPGILGLIAGLVGLGVVGTVVLAVTPAGCRFGLHGTTCTGTVGTVGILTPPSPTQLVTPTPRSTILPPTTPVPPPSQTPVPGPALPPYEYTASQGAPPPWYGIGSGSAPSNISLNCRLPIYAGPSGSGGFISFPGGTFTGDPRSAVTLPSPPAGYPAQPPGYGPGLSGLTYDQAFDRWLPVAWRFVAPDGKHYAYLYGGEGIFSTTVSTGAQTELGDGHTWSLLDIESGGVYASMTTQGQPVAGLWWLPFTGQPSQVATTGYWQREAAGYAYGTAASAVPNGVSTLILRLNLKTGAQDPWFEVDGAVSTVAGFDAAGQPLIVANANGYLAFWLATGPGTAQVIDYQGPFQQGNWYGTTADQNGIWESGQGMLLLIPGKAKWTMSSITGQLAGGCQ